MKIYSADQSTSSFSSHPTTPVSSPPPLTSVNQPQWNGPPHPHAHPAGVANTSSPLYNERNLHMVRFKNILFYFPFLACLLPSFLPKTDVHEATFRLIECDSLERLIVDGSCEPSCLFVLCLCFCLKTKWGQVFVFRFSYRFEDVNDAKPFFFFCCPVCVCVTNVHVYLFSDLPFCYFFFFVLLLLLLLLPLFCCRLVACPNKNDSTMLLAFSGITLR